MISLRFAWYDLWVGAFIDRAQRKVYICPLPCILITFTLGQRSVPTPEAS